MVVMCAFYGLVNRTTKVKLQVEHDKLGVGQAFTFEGNAYTILSVFESEGIYHANVALQQVHRPHISPRAKPPFPTSLEFDDNDGCRQALDVTLQHRLKTTETRLQHLEREREEVLRLLDQAIEQLDRIHQSDGTSV